MKTDLETRLATGLGASMTDAQQATLDARLAARLAGRNGRAGSSARRRSLVAVSVIAVLAISAVVGVSAAIRLTESPFGLASAEEFAREVEAAKQVVPIPSGATWPGYLAVDDRSGTYAREGGQTWVEFVAVCLWSESWLAAERGGDAATRTTATDALRDVPTWAIYRRADPSDTNLRETLDQIITAARLGDAAHLEEFVTVNCAP